VIFNLVGPFYPLRGGIAQYIGVLGQKLEEKGHRVKVLAFRKQFPRFLFPGQTQVEASKEYIHLESEAVFIPWNPLTWYRTYRSAKTGEAQALVFKFWMPFFAPGYAAVCALIHWFSKIRLIYIIDNVIPHEKRPGDRFFTRLAFRWVDGFIVQSEVVRQDLYKWFPRAKRRQVIFVPHPIYDSYSGSDLSREEARARLHRPSGEKLLLFFGLVRRYKGLDTLLEAMPEVVRSLGEVHLLVAGEFYEPEADYRQLIEKLGIAKHITLINQYIPNEDVSLYFRAAEVLVLPYRSATQSGVIQVAHHFAMPVIYTRVGGLPEVIREGETGFLVEPERPAALAKAIVEFFQYRNSEALRLGLESARHRYSWDNMIQAIEKLTQNKVGQD
jgi:D-inositol-3-phosphate glycosyltransferase